MTFRKRRKQSTFQLQPSGSKIELERVVSDEMKRVMQVPAMPSLIDTSLVELMKTSQDGDPNAPPTPTVVLMDIQLGDLKGPQVKARSTVGVQFVLTLANGAFAAVHRENPVLVIIGI